MRNEGVNFSRLMVESSLERQDDWETLAQRNFDLQQAIAAQRQAAEQAQAHAQAQAAAQAEAEAAAQAQYEAARAAAAEAAAASAPTVMLPTDDEAMDQAVLVTGASDTYTEQGAYTQELEARLDGLTVPEELQLSVDNLRAATAEADSLMAQGYVDQGTSMYDAIQYASEPIFQALDAAQVAPVVVEDVAPQATVAADTAVAANVEAPKAAAVPTSPLDNTQPQPNDYFNGKFDSPPPGGWFYGIGDAGRTGQAGGVYQWLSEVVAARAKASDHGHYLLAGSDQVTSVGQHLSDVAVYPVDYEVEVYSSESHYFETQTKLLPRAETIGELRTRGLDDTAIAAYLSANEKFMVQPGYYTGGDGGSDVPPVYGTRSDYLSAIGLGPNVPMDLQISFNASGSGGGDAWLDASRAQGNAMWGGPQQAHVAIVDDALASDWVQIGDIGPINDDVNEMLGGVYEKYGATTPEQKEAIRNVLFKYDERFGVLGNREFVDAAVEKNNARRQGFFEGAVGRTLLTVAASFIPYVGPYVAMALNAGFQLSDGASFGQVVAGAAVSYFTQQYTADFGNYVAGAFGDSISPAVAEVIAAGARNLGNTAINQLMSGKGLDGDGLLLAAAAGGFGSFITNFIDGSDFGKALDEQFGRGRSGDILGRLGASAIDGKITASDFVGAFAAGRADQVTQVEGKDGTHAFVKTDNGMIAYNPDGSITQLEQGDDGQVVATTYDANGNRIVSADAFTGALANPVWRTATLSDAANIQLTGESFFSGLAGIFDVPTDGFDFAGFDGGYTGTLSFLGGMLGGASLGELDALERGGFGLDAAIPMSAAAIEETPLVVPDLTVQTYTKDLNGLETWRNPETGAIVYQRAPDGATLAVVDGRRVVSDPQGKVVSVQGGSFGAAFSQARSSGTAVFEYNGNRYSTVTREDLLRQSGGDVDAYRRYVAQTGDVSLEGYAARITDNKWAALQQGGVDSAYWKNLGFTPEQVATVYAVNGNDHRLATMTPNTSVSSESLATTVANNLGKLPQGFSDLYATMVNAGSDFLMSQQQGGQTMSGLEAFGAAANWLVNRGRTALQSLKDNTSSTGEAALVVTGAVLNLAWDATGGALERTYKTMTDPNATPQQVAVSTFEFFGAVASVVGATGVVRSATAGAGLTTEGLSTAGSAATRTIADAAGILLPDQPGAARHMDFVGNAGAAPRAMGDVNDVYARIANIDMAAETKHLYDSFDSARDLANVYVGPLKNDLGIAQGQFSSYDLALLDSLVEYQNFGGSVARLSDGTAVFPVGVRPDGLEVIGIDAFAPLVARHEAQHILDYASAAMDKSSPYLVRMEWPGSTSDAYKAFSYTELNGFGISAEELSRAYVFAAANGDVAGAAKALKGYETVLGLYDSMLGRVEDVFGSAVSLQSRQLMSQTLTPSSQIPTNKGFQVVDFQVVGTDGQPVKMSAQVPEGLTGTQLYDAVNEQLTSGINMLDGYVDFRAARAADLDAIRQHYQREFPTVNTNTGNGGTGGRGGQRDTGVEP